MKIFLLRKITMFYMSHEWLVGAFYSIFCHFLFQSDLTGVVSLPPTEFYKSAIRDSCWAI